MPAKAWSYSALNDFETCPKKYYHTRVAKTFKESTSEAMTWGKNVHESFEKYMKNKTPFPVGMKQFAPIADAFKIPDEHSANVLVEEQLALNTKLQPTGYFDKDVWVRVVIDYGVINKDKALIVDWKTGKKSSNKEQLALMAGVIMKQEPELKRVDSTFVWLKEKQPSEMVEKVTYTRNDLKDIWQSFLPRVKEFQSAFDNEDFPANPNFLCKRHCPVTSCPYNGT